MEAINIESKQDVIIVGGGLAGLTAATILARAGQTVTLYEKSSRLGGRAATTIKGGFYFNQGPHALYNQGAGYKILKELGIQFTGGKPSVAGSAIFQGQLHTLPTGPASFLTTSLLTVAGKAEMLQFYTRLSKINPQALGTLSLEEWLNREFKREEVRQLIATLARVSTYANAPRLQTAASFVAQLQLSVKEGVWYLDGGWQTLVEGLAQAAREAGARIETSQRVEEVEHAGQDGVKGVWLADGRFQAAQAVILATATPARTSDLVDGGQHPILSEWAKNAWPVQAACLDLALRQLPRPDRFFALGIDQPLYYSVHSKVAKLGPAGSQIIHAAIYLSPNDETDPLENEQSLEKMLDLIQPGWQNELLERRFLPRMTVYYQLKSIGPVTQQATQVPGIVNLYVAGDWIPGQGLLVDAALASAKQAASSILAQTGFSHSTHLQAVG